MAERLQYFDDVFQSDCSQVNDFGIGGNSKKGSASMVLIKRLFVILILTVILILIAGQGCSIEEEVYLQTVLPPKYLPVFLISRDENFQSPCPITSLRVYVRGDGSIADRIYWDIEVRLTGPRRPGSGRQIPVEISRITYGIIPYWEFEERYPPRKLERGVEYCVTISAPGASEDPIDCFIYRP